MKIGQIEFKARNAQMPAFNWIFALIIGAAILFIAVVFSGKLIETKGYETSAETAANFDFLLNPFASIGALGEVSMTKTISMPYETIAEISCDDENQELGEQELMLKTKTAFGKWSSFIEEKPVYDKYIFAETLEGKKFDVFSKSFNIPFRIDDLIYLIDENYCFNNAPAEINNEVASLNLAFLKTSESNCAEKSKNVCFNTGTGASEACNVFVKCLDEDEKCDYGYVEKQEDGKTKKLYFAGQTLMYAAVFSSKENYECNFDRLMSRLILLDEIYENKANSLEVKGCAMENSYSLLQDLSAKAQEAKTSKNTNSMENLYKSSQTLDDANINLYCSIF